MKTLTAHIENLLQDNQADSHKTVELIDWRLIKAACKKMKSGKTDVSGSYTSELLLEAPESLYIHLANIFKSYLIHGTVT